MTTEKRSIDKDNLFFNVSVVIVDIEGTTTSINFVKETLFPYAREHLEEYVNKNWSEKELKEDVSLLREQAVKDAADKIEGVVNIPEGDGDDVKASVIKNVLWQMDNDRKTKSLKQLQGHIWRSGYSAGKIVGHIYDDVEECLKSWNEAGKKLYVYSSGSVEAQKLLFGNTKSGDLLPVFSGYFDTEVGPKTESSSYTKILERLKENGHLSGDGNDVLFLTDVPKEAQAATEAGIQVAIVIREGNAPLPDDIKESYPTISSFSDLTFEGNAKRRKLSHESDNVDKNDVKAENTEGGNEADKDVEMEVCTNDNSTVSESVVVNSDNPAKQTESMDVKTSGETADSVSDSKQHDEAEKQGSVDVKSTEEQSKADSKQHTDANKKQESMDVKSTEEQSKTESDSASGGNSKDNSKTESEPTAADKETPVQKVSDSEKHIDKTSDTKDVNGGEKADAALETTKATADSASADSTVETTKALPDSAGVNNAEVTTKTASDSAKAANTEDSTKITPDSVNNGNSKESTKTPVSGKENDSGDSSKKIDSGSNNSKETSKSEDAEKTEHLVETGKKTSDSMDVSNSDETASTVPDAEKIKPTEVSSEKSEVDCLPASDENKDKEVSVKKDVAKVDEKVSGNECIQKESDVKEKSCDNNATINGEQVKEDCVNVPDSTVETDVEMKELDENVKEENSVKKTEEKMEQVVDKNLQKEENGDNSMEVCDSQASTTKETNKPAESLVENDVEMAEKGSEVKSAEKTEPVLEKQPNDDKKVQPQKEVSDGEMSKEDQKSNVKKECLPVKDVEKSVIDSTMEEVKENGKETIPEKKVEANEEKPKAENSEVKSNEESVNNTTECKDAANGPNVDSAKHIEKANSKEEEESKAAKDDKTIVKEDKSSLSDEKVAEPSSVKTESKKADNEISSEEADATTKPEVLKNGDANEETEEKKTDLNNSTPNGTHETCKNGVTEEQNTNVPGENTIKEKALEKVKESSTEQNGVEATTAEV